MKKRVLIALLCALGISQSAQAKVIFSCKTTNNKYIEVHKLKGGVYEYKFGTPAKTELTIRNTKSELLKRAERWEDRGGYGATIPFKNGEYIYSVVAGVSWNVDDGMNSMSGVLVGRKGKLITSVECTPATAQNNFDDDNFRIVIGD